MDEALMAIVQKLLELPEEVLVQVIEEIAKAKDIDLSDIEDDMGKEADGEGMSEGEGEGGEQSAGGEDLEQDTDPNDQFDPAQMFLQ